MAEAQEEEKKGAAVKEAEEVYKVTLVEENIVQEEEAGDLDDPLAMLGGMGEEQVYQVTQMAEAQEEEEAGDVDDPLAMLGGMGEEQVYQVTQMAEAQEEEEAGDVDYPLA